MKDEEHILRKLDACRLYYERLLELRPALVKGQADWVVWSAAERNLQLVLECAIDVGEMVISWKRLDVAEENRDVFRILGEAGLLDAELAERLVRAAGLRNLLVHQYGRLDPERLRKAIVTDLGDLDEFAKVVGRLLGP